MVVLEVLGETNMLDKDKIIIIVYFGVKYIDNYHQVCYNLNQQLINAFDESVKVLVVPMHDEKGIKFECINPVLLDDEHHKKVEEKIKEFEEKIKGLSNEKK